VIYEEYEEEKVLSDGKIGTKRVKRMCKILKEPVIQQCMDPIKMLRKCDICLFRQTFKYQEVAHDLNYDKEMMRQILRQICV
jgi:hypothetical protein